MYLILIKNFLQNKLETVLPENIHKDQTGFIRQKQTQDNIRKTLLIMKYVKKKM